MHEVNEEARFLTVRNGAIHSPMLNVVTMLTPNHPGDGCFTVIPGSHKKNFTLDKKRWGTAGLDTPGAIEITGEPGDVMLFTEALSHAGAPRRNFFHPSGTATLIPPRLPRPAATGCALWPTLSLVLLGMGKEGGGPI